MKTNNDLLLFLFPFPFGVLENRFDHHSRLFAENPANFVGSGRLTSGGREMRGVIPD